MDLSPPSLTRSPVSSPNTDYPSPDLVDSHYALASMYDQTCVMDPHFESNNTLPPLEATSSADWSDTIALHPATTSGMHNMLSAEYDPFAHYDPSLPPAYSHDIYASHTSHVPSISLSSHQLGRTLSHSPDPSSRHSFSYRHSISPPPRIKMERASDYPNPVDGSQYPSPHLSHPVPIDVGSHSSAASSSGYLSDVPSDPWPKSEYPSLEPEVYHSGSGDVDSSLLQDRQPYRIQRTPRTRQRRLTTRDEANFQCAHRGCGKLFSRSYNYKAHLETHDDKREYPFPCMEADCNKKFVRKTDLQRHHQSVHMKERNHKCDYCSRMFARKDTLRRYGYISKLKIESEGPQLLTFLRHMEDGCSKRFDIGIMDLRSEDYGSYSTRSSGDLLAPAAQLPPMTSSQLQSPHPNHLEPIPSSMRRER
jgi:uncharacterized Zn-finger protein